MDKMQLIFIAIGKLGLSIVLLTLIQIYTFLVSDNGTLNLIASFYSGKARHYHYKEVLRVEIPSFYPIRFWFTNG